MKMFEREAKPPPKPFRQRALWMPHILFSPLALPLPCFVPFPLWLWPSPPRGRHQPPFQAIFYSNFSALRRQSIWASLCSRQVAKLIAFFFTNPLFPLHIFAFLFLHIRSTTAGFKVRAQWPWQKGAEWGRIDGWAPKGI